MPRTQQVGVMPPRGLLERCPPRGIKTAGRLSVTACSHREAAHCPGNVRETRDRRSARHAKGAPPIHRHAFGVTGRRLGEAVCNSGVGVVWRNKMRCREGASPPRGSASARRQNAQPTATNGPERTLELVAAKSGFEPRVPKCGARHEGRLCWTDMANAPAPGTPLPISP